MIAEAIAGLSSARVSNSDGSGRHCRYVRVNKDWGLKIYKAQWMRDLQYSRQRFFCEYVLAPLTKEKFEIVLDDTTLYGYVTQDVDPIDEDLPEDKHAALQLVNRLAKEFNVDWGDAWAPNCGKLPCGTIIPIDFGDMFPADTSEDCDPIFYEEDTEGQSWYSSY